MLQKETILRTLERIMMAITFAEANCHEEAIRILKAGDKKRLGQVKRIEKDKQRPQARL